MTKANFNNALKWTSYLFRHQMPELYTEIGNDALWTESARETDFVDKLVHASFANRYASDRPGSLCAAV
jgi:hypothetical protein